MLETLARTGGSPRARPGPQIGSVDDRRCGRHAGPGGFSPARRRREPRRPTPYGVAVDLAIADRRHLVVQAGHRHRQVPGLPDPGRPLGRSGSWWPPPPRPFRTNWPPTTCPLSPGPSNATSPTPCSKGGATTCAGNGSPKWVGAGEQLSLPPGGADPPDADDTLTPAPVTDAVDRLGRLGDQVRRLVRWADDDRHRGSGRARVRAALPGLGHGLDHRPGVPGRLPVPLGSGLLRRGSPGPGSRGRRGGGQHPSLRRPSGQRRCRAPSHTRWSSSTRPMRSRR